MMNYEIGYDEETAAGTRWIALKTIQRASDAEAEAEIDSLKRLTPTDLDGVKRGGLHIKRGSVRWFRPFSCHA